LAFFSFSAPHVVFKVQREQLPRTIGHFPDDTADSPGPANSATAELHVRGRRRFAGGVWPVATSRPLHADGWSAAQGQVSGRHQVTSAARVWPRPDQPVHVADDGGRGRSGRGGRAPGVVRRAHDHVVFWRLRLR